MPAKKHKPEGIIRKLREVEIMLGQGGTTAEAYRRIGVSEQNLLLLVAMGHALSRQSIRYAGRGYDQRIFPAG